MFKKSIFLLTLVLFTSCGSSKVDQTVTLEKRPVIRRSGNTFVVEDANQKKLDDKSSQNSNTYGTLGAMGSVPSYTGPGAAMAYLASDVLEGRKTGSAGIEKAALFVERFFKDNDIPPYFSDYRDPVNIDDLPAFNIVAWLPGNDPELKDEFVVIGAHYDHIGDGKQVDGDAIANGANDNASGTAVVLEIAKQLAASNDNARSVVFALFTAEEMGLVGSKQLAKKFNNAGMDLYTMLNFEMVGVPMNRDYSLYLTGYQDSNMAEITNSYAGEKLVGFLPTAQEQNLFKRSDNYAFYKEFGVPSQTFSSFDFTNFDHYHGVNDEADQQDVKHIQTIANKMAPVVRKIINARSKEILSYR